MSDNYTDTDAVRWLDECVSQIPAPPADVTKEQAVIRYCAGEIAQLRKEENYLSRLVDKQADILTRTANVLKGEPEELAMHSHHDLAEVAAALQARAAEFEAAQRADCINFHFWWMGAKGTNTKPLRASPRHGTSTRLKHERTTSLETTNQWRNIYDYSS